MRYYVCSECANKQAGGQGTATIGQMVETLNVMLNRNSMPDQVMAPSMKESIRDALREKGCSACASRFS